MVFAILAVLFGVVVPVVVHLAHFDTETMDRHLDTSWDLGRWFAVGALFCLFLEPAGPHPFLSLCAGGAVGCFAYHAGCRVGAYFRE